MPFTSPAALLAAALLSVASFAASAQTGRPSEAPRAQPAVAVANADEPGSYARYLMLNGTPRDVAIEKARNIDHPAATRHVRPQATAATAQR